MANGLQGQEFNSNAFHQGRDGRLFFGGVNGFNGFDPASIEDSDYRPTIKIMGFLPISTSTAMQLLQHSEQNVAEIAYRVGFNDPNYFSRAFSKEFGAAPSDFRK
jgi:hypothetical protein